ncbi:MAG: hypothetical protein QG629_23 [Patescibacteria group bacterium]|nr:hypothetical protein [Candidatus Saccharibacteria bacterium]MDQ5962941.1 hypothetical protein [Patescibacteria group bacterium]
MFTFELDRVYAIDVADRCVGLRDGIPEPVAINRIESPTPAPFWAHGIQKNDLAVFASVVTNGDFSSQGFVVVTAGSNQGLLATCESIAQDPETLINPDLAKKLASVPIHELAQFGDDLLQVRNFCTVLYPEINDFT